jgi:hypothetical protein
MQLESKFGQENASMPHNMTLVCIGICICICIYICARAQCTNLCVYVHAYTHITLNTMSVNMTYHLRINLCKFVRTRIRIRSSRNAQPQIKRHATVCVNIYICIYIICMYVLCMYVCMYVCTVSPNLCVVQVCRWLMLSGTISR